MSQEGTDDPACRVTLHVGQTPPVRTPPDDFADDVLIARANLDEPGTNVPGTIFVSTMLGAHGPRVKRYADRPGRSLPCLIVPIGPDPQPRDDCLPPIVSRAALPRITE